MRVAVRRLRSALTAVKPMLPVEHHRWASEELKWLTHSLAPARNWDVFVGDLLRTVSDALSNRPELQQLVRAADQCNRERPSTTRNKRSYPNDTPARCFGFCDGLRFAVGEISRYRRMQLFFLPRSSVLLRACLNVVTAKPGDAVNASNSLLRQSGIGCASR